VKEDEPPLIPTLKALLYLNIRGAALIRIVAFIWIRVLIDKNTDRGKGSTTCWKGGVLIGKWH